MRACSDRSCSTEMPTHTLTDQTFPELQQVPGGPSCGTVTDEPDTNADLTHHSLALGVLLLAVSLSPGEI